MARGRLQRCTMLNTSTCQGVEIKVIDKDKVLRVGLITQIKREISIMRLARHSNVLQPFEVMATKTKIYFALEYAKGVSFSIVERKVKGKHCS